MAPDVDPLAVILRSVRVVGADFCWPANEILEVLQAFEQLDRVVLGAELWSFEDRTGPTVVGWTQYDVSDGRWSERVADASRKAADDLLGHAGDRSVWVNLTWEAPADGNG